MSDIIILMGLPGSGKTTYAKHAYKMEEKFSGRTYGSWNGDTVLFVDIDVPDISQEEKKLKLRDWTRNKQIHYVIDGLCLTTDDVIRVLKNISVPIQNVHIHFWKEDREACLYNDTGRRPETSRNTILHAKLEAPDAKKIKQAVNVKQVVVYNHSVIRKPAWKKVAGQHGIEIKNEKYLDSEDWSLGGSFGNCFDDTMTSYGPEEESDFEEFDQLLEDINPNINFRQYKKLYKDCVKMETKRIPDYYGGGETRAWWRCDLKKLFSELEKLGYFSGKVGEEHI